MVSFEAFIPETFILRIARVYPALRLHSSAGFAKDLDLYTAAHFNCANALFGTLATTWK
jgi:hypothetical protein